MATSHQEVESSSARLGNPFIGTEPRPEAVGSGRARDAIGDDARKLLKAGDYAFGPRGIPPGFCIEGDEPARILLMTTGSDFADFIGETSVPSDTPSAAPDMALLVAAAERHNISILGPLPH